MAQARSRSKRSRDSDGAISKLTSTGSPEARAAAATGAAEEETRERLYFRAAELGINGRSRMTKDALAEAIRRHEAETRGGSRE